MSLTVTYTQTKKEIMEESHPYTLRDPPQKPPLGSHDGSLSLTKKEPR